MHPHTLYVPSPPPHIIFTLTNPTSPPLVSGTGLMYINNVGSVVLALANNASSPAPTSGKFDEIEVARVQATQVSVISVWNCLGRVSMGRFHLLFFQGGGRLRLIFCRGVGMLSDYAKTRFGINRVRPIPTLLPHPLLRTANHPDPRKQVWFTLLIALIFLASQVSAQMTQDMYALSRVSGLLGMAYGNLFALLPIVVLEWFGLCEYLTPRRNVRGASADAFWRGV